MGSISVRRVVVVVFLRHINVRVGVVAVRVSMTQPVGVEVVCVVAILVWRRWCLTIHVRDVVVPRASIGVVRVCRV